MFGVTQVDLFVHCLSKGLIGQRWSRVPAMKPQKFTWHPGRLRTTLLHRPPQAGDPAAASAAPAPPEASRARGHDLPRTPD